MTARPVSDALPRLAALERLAHDLSFRPSDAFVTQQQADCAAEIAEIRAALDPVHLAYRALLHMVSELADGRPHDMPGRPVSGYAAFAAFDELCGEADPSVQWLKARENARAQVAEMALRVATKATELAAEAAKGLPEIERWRASVAVERRAAE